MPGLRGTNIPGYDATVSDIVFSADLERASYVVKKGSGHSTKVRRFTPGTLAAIARRRQAAHERTCRIPEPSPLVVVGFHESLREVGHVFRKRDQLGLAPIGADDLYTQWQSLRAQPECEVESGMP